MRILITGGAGFIGCNFVRYAKKGVQIIVMSYSIIMDSRRVQKDHIFLNILTHI